jgi:hypothetical protein
MVHLYPMLSCNLHDERQSNASEVVTHDLSMPLLQRHNEDQTEDIPQDNARSGPHERLNTDQESAHCKLATHA